MSLKDLIRPAVDAAIDEFDRVGRDAFLRQYGFGRSRGYFLVRNGREYDSKAIAGAAHGHLGSSWQPLKAADFAGGEHAVARTLRKLGYAVIGPADRRDEFLPFEVGQLYNRREYIHERYGGQQQGGISTPAGAPYVFLFTSGTGAQYGYGHDGWRDDGLFAYTGEGQRGDMQFVRGNKTIRDHLQESRDLLLFQAHSQRGWYRFLGCFACAGVEARRAPDVDGNDREVLIFLLAPVPEVEQSARQHTPPTGRALEGLRQAAYAAAAATPAIGQGLRTYHERSAAVRGYVLARAKGVCECCDVAAPFKRQDGSPYLEPHHTRRLADGGPDNPRWVGAICPNCHREIHHGENGKALNEQLQEWIRQVEEAAGRAAIKQSDSPPPEPFGAKAL